MCYSKYITDSAFTNLSDIFFGALGFYPPLLSLILRCLQSRTKPILPLLVDIVLKTTSNIDMAARKGSDIEVSTNLPTIESCDCHRDVTIAALDRR